MYVDMYVCIYHHNPTLTMGVIEEVNHDFLSSYAPLHNLICK